MHCGNEGALLDNGSTWFTSLPPTSFPMKQSSQEAMSRTRLSSLETCSSSSERSETVSVSPLSKPSSRSSSVSHKEGTLTRTASSPQSLLSCTRPRSFAKLSWCRLNSKEGLVETPQIAWQTPHDSACKVVRRQALRPNSLCRLPNVEMPGSLQVVCRKARSITRRSAVANDDVPPSNDPCPHQVEAGIPMQDSHSCQSRLGDIGKVRRRLGDSRRKPCYLVSVENISADGSDMATKPMTASRPSLPVMTAWTP